MIFDSHTHVKRQKNYSIEEENQLDEYKKIVSEGQMGVLVNTSDTEEYEEFFSTRQKFEKGFYLSFGIHPWYADLPHNSLSKLYEYYKSADAIGEIGIDSVWCNVDLQIQEHVFRWQLQVAEDLNKPVILHTKGQESKIAQILKSYKIKKLVHWYSCEDYLNEYISQDCYFTIATDFYKSDIVRKIIKNVPLQRLLVETDGTDAVKWAIGADICTFQIPGILEKAVSEIAKIKSISWKAAESALEENFFRFLQK